MRDRERLTIWAGLGDDLDEQLGRFVRCLVEADPRENDGRTGALRTRRQRGDHVTQLGFGSA